MRAALALGLDRPPGADACALAAQLATDFGDATLAVVHYGSRAQGRPTRTESAYDFFVIVREYRSAYRSLHDTAGTHYRPGVAAALARVLPPNVISVSDRSGAGQRAKCAVLSEQDFRRASSERARDHFVRGRLMQCLTLAWSRDPGSARLVTDAVVAARADTYEWVRAFLPERFSVEEYCRTLLDVSFAGEIRPEPRSHIVALYEAQRELLFAIYGPWLEHLAERDLLVREGETYRHRAPPDALDRARIRFYFRSSKARATLRLLKHVVLYEGWLDYILHKVSRSTGERIEVTERERRWPLIFMWPKILRYLRTRPQRRD